MPEKKLLREMCKYLKKDLLQNAKEQKMVICYSKV